jgi:hypothetical protein
MLVAALLLCGCTSLSAINADANRQYAVSATTRNPFVSWGHLMNVGLKQATTFCAQQDKGMHTVTVGTFGVRGWSQREADLRFECVPRWQED